MNYSPSEFVKNCWSLLTTKLFFRPARLIRRPVYIRGGKGMEFGSGFTTGYRCRFEMFNPEKATLHIGDNCKIGDNVHIVASEEVTIGNNCLLASHIFISDTSHGIYKGDAADSPHTRPNDRCLVTSPVTIGDRVWIGENVVILPGSVIGNGCIIGANAVVSGVFEDNCIIGGVPAKRIKRWNESIKNWERVE